MKYALIFLAVFTQYVQATDCKEINDPGTPFNQSIVALIEDEDASKAYNLLNNGMDANHSNVCGATLLHVAAIMNNQKLAERLVEKGGNPNSINSLNQTPVFLASNWASNEILKILLEAGGNPNHQIDETSPYNSVLLISVVNNNIEGVKLLLKYGANHSFTNRQGVSALSLAKEKEFHEIVSLLNKIKP